MWFLFRVKQPYVKPIVESTPPLPSFGSREKFDRSLCVKRHFAAKSTM